MNVASVGEQLARVQARIAAVERSWTHPIDVVAVTKGFGPEAIEVAVGAGCGSIGENYAQELAGKRDVIERLATAGALHRPPAEQQGPPHRAAGRRVGDRRSGVDRDRDRPEGRRRAGADPGQRHRRGVEVRCPPQDVAALVGHATQAGLDVAGLMTIGPTDGDTDRTTRAFVQTRTLVDELGLDVCSMGMSGDYELAVSCGSTQLRLGSILFGPRPPA